MKLKILAVVALLIGSVLGASALTTGTYAAGGKCPEGSYNETYTNSLAECNIPTDYPGSDKKLTERVVDIINVIVGVVGLLAIVVVVIGAILFVTSTGEAAKVARARNTILYGVVGLVISMLAFAIVSFVSGAVFKDTSSSSSTNNNSNSNSSSDNSQQPSGN